MHSPMMKSVGMIACLIAALASIAIGLMAMNVDVLSWPLLSHPQILMVIKYIVGISGVIGLLMVLMGHPSECRMQK